jgi:hypothetical protein
VFDFDRDAVRFETLTKTCDLAGTLNAAATGVRVRD